MDEKTIISIGSIAAGGLIKLGLEWIKKEKEKKDLIPILGSLYHRVNEFQKAHNIQRFLILRIERGKDGKVSILFESTSVVSAFNIYQNYEPDTEYYKLIKSLKKLKNTSWEIRNITSKTLKDAYTSQGIKKINIFYISDTKRYIYYGSAASTEDIDLNNDNFNANFNGIVNTIRNVYTEYAI
jgi:hypothetical protein